MGRALKNAQPSGLSDKELLSMARNLGAVGPRIIPPQTVETGCWVRLKCQFGCSGYGMCLTCPPHSPTPERTRQTLDEYRRAIFFELGKGVSRRIAVELERQLFLQGYYKAFAMAAGPCDLCDECGLEEGCRHRGEARPALEACGIDVYATARRHGFTIEVVRGHKDPQHYFAMVLLD